MKAIVVAERDHRDPRSHRSDQLRTRRGRTAMMRHLDDRRTEVRAGPEHLAFALGLDVTGEQRRGAAKLKPQHHRLIVLLGLLGIRLRPYAAHLDSAD